MLESGTDDPAKRDLNITLCPEWLARSHEELEFLDTEMLFSLSLLLKKLDDMRSTRCTWPQLVGAFGSTPSLVEDGEGISNTRQYTHRDRGDFKMVAGYPEPSAFGSVRRQFDLYRLNHALRYSGTQVEGYFQKLLGDAQPSRVRGATRLDIKALALLMATTTLKKYVTETSSDRRDEEEECEIDLGVVRWPSAEDPVIQVRLIIEAFGCQVNDFRQIYHLKLLVWSEIHVNSGPSRRFRMLTGIDGGNPSPVGIDRS